MSLGNIFCDTCGGRLEPINEKKSEAKCVICGNTYFIKEAELSGTIKNRVCETGTKKQISNEELLVLTKKAFEQNEVVDFLQGTKEYDCPVDRFVPANVPTDFGRILRYGVTILYEETKDETIISKLKEAILKLSWGDVVQVWVAYTLCWFYIYDRHNQKTLLNFFDDNLLKIVKLAVLKNESALRKCKEWQGWNNENGLWGDISRCDTNLKNNYGVCIL